MTSVLTPAIPRATTLAVGLGLALLVLAPAPATATTEPEDVVAEVVRSGGDRYAGPCAGTHPERDRGAVCSRLMASGGTRRAYLTGRTFSEFSTWVFVERTAAGWRAIATVPLDFTDQTGTIPWP